VGPARGRAVWGGDEGPEGEEKQGASVVGGESTAGVEDGPLRAPEPLEGPLRHVAEERHVGQDLRQGGLLPPRPPPLELPHATLDRSDQAVNLVLSGNSSGVNRDDISIQVTRQRQRNR